MDIGIDILDTDRMDRLVDKKIFLKKYYSKCEIEYISANLGNKAQIMASYYSCKEAFLKAIGLGIGRGIDLKDISIKYNDLGRPYIDLTKEALDVFHSLGYTSSSINISDSKNLTVAVCIVY